MYTEGDIVFYNKNAVNYRTYAIGTLVGVVDWDTNGSYLWKISDSHYRISFRFSYELSYLTQLAKLLYL